MKLLIIRLQDKRNCLLNKVSVEKIDQLGPRKLMKKTCVNKLKILISNFFLLIVMFKQINLWSKLKIITKWTFSVMKIKCVISFNHSLTP